MAMRAESNVLLRRRILALEKRVRAIEKALGNATDGAQRISATARRREHEASIRRDAIKDYYAQKRTERLRNNPWMLKSEQEAEDDLNAFLRSRGLEPAPTDIPKELRKQARALIASRRRRSAR